MKGSDRVQKGQKVCVIGLWHLGLVSAAALADLGCDVTGFDSSPELISDLRQAKLPLYEPGLEVLVKNHLETQRLRFETELKKTLAGSQTVLITYDTPLDEKDQVDLTVIDNTIQAIIPLLERDTLLVVNSQVPVGSCERWQKIIDKQKPDWNIDLIYSPENIRLGQAIELFRQPDMIVIGSNSERARKKAEKFYELFPVDKFYVSWRTAEMAKHALNAFFATSISFANEMGNLCDAVGADGMQIAKILKKDSRIGKRAQVRPGLGFAGATLARDLTGLQNLGKEYGVPMPLAGVVLEINRKQIERVAKMVEQYFEGQLRGKILTVFGLTYKPGTSTLRRSASLEIMGLLHSKGVRLRAYDPKADLSEYKGEMFFEFFQDPYEAAGGSNGILLFTEWPEFKQLDYSRIKKLMAHPMILDTKNHLDAEKLKQLGFNYLEIGRGQLTEVKS